MFTLEPAMETTPFTALTKTEVIVRKLEAAAMRLVIPTVSTLIQRAVFMYPIPLLKTQLRRPASIAQSNSIFSKYGHLLLINECHQSRLFG